MISDLSMGRSTREEKTERREVKVVSLEYSSSVQWNILLGVITIITIRDVTMMTIIMVTRIDDDHETSPCVTMNVGDTTHQTL